MQVDGNAITKLPAEITALPKLWELCISYKNLSGDYLNSLIDRFQEVKNSAHSAVRTVAIPPAIAPVALKARHISEEEASKPLTVVFTGMTTDEILHVGQISDLQAELALDELKKRAPSLLEYVQETGVKAVVTARENYRLELERGKLALLAALKDQSPAFCECATLDEALKKEEQLLGEVTCLSLSNETKLPMRLPPEIARFTSLRELEVSDCNMTELPASIGQCEKLINLIMFDNQLTRLPPEIGHCIALVTLNLNQNNIIDLPAELGSCVALENLECWYNSLRALPPELGNLKALKNLDVSDNCLQELPSTLAACRALVDLNASDNYLRDIPPELGECKMLKALSLSRNQLTELPAALAGLTALKKADFSDNHLLSLPQGIEQCVHLKELFVHNNNLTSLPPGLGHCRKLYRLTVDGNKIVKLPETIASSLSLIYLSISSKNLTKEQFKALAREGRHIENSFEHLPE